MSTLAQTETPESATLPPVVFPRTWGDLQDVLDTVGFNGPYGNRRIVLMQGQNGDYTNLREGEIHLITLLGMHEPGEFFSDPHDVAQLRTVLRILGVPITSSPAQPDREPSRAAPFRRAMGKLFGQH